jgi:hypothetical protein
MSFRHAQYAQPDAALCVLCERMTSFIIYAFAGFDYEDCLC